MRKLLLMAGVPALMLFADLASADVFDAVTDFSNNPTTPVSDSVWSYGYSNTLGSFTLHGTSTTGLGLLRRRRPVNQVSISNVKHQEESNE
jgi:hypothetical protein